VAASFLKVHVNINIAPDEVGMKAEAEADDGSRETNVRRSTGIRGWVDRLFFTTATVTKVADLAPGFRLLDLEGSELTKSQGKAGDKIQLRASSTFGLRTYTPLDWDRARGRFRICAFLHGAGPGATWMRALRDGNACSFFGPRGSLAFEKMTGPIVLFGDETSIGVAAALRALRGSEASVVLEGTSARDVSLVAETLGLSDVHAFAKKPDDEHLGDAAKAIARAAASGGTIVLTGRARSIVTVRDRLYAEGVTTKMRSKAYWADGRTGLD